jgi:hypothetical protein
MICLALSLYFQQRMQLAELGRLPMHVLICRSEQGAGQKRSWRELSKIETGVATQPLEPDDRQAQSYHDKYEEQRSRTDARRPAAQRHDRADHRDSDRPASIHSQRNSLRHDRHDDYSERRADHNTDSRMRRDDHLQPDMLDRSGSGRGARHFDGEKEAPTQRITASEKRFRERQLEVDDTPRPGFSRLNAAQSRRSSDGDRRSFEQQQQPRSDLRDRHADMRERREAPSRARHSGDERSRHDDAHRSGGWRDQRTDERSSRGRDSPRDAQRSSRQLTEPQYAAPRQHWTFAAKAQPSQTAVNRDDDDDSDSYASDDNYEHQQLQQQQQRRRDAQSSSDSRDDSSQRRRSDRGADHDRPSAHYGSSERDSAASKQSERSSRRGSSKPTSVRALNSSSNSNAASFQPGGKMARFSQKQQLEMGIVQDDQARGQQLKIMKAIQEHGQRGR